MSRLYKKNTNPGTAKINIAVIQFPGTNTERETMLALYRVGMNPVEFLWNDDRSLLDAFDGFIIAGGFSYEDRSRAGIIAALDPIMEIIRKQAAHGKPVLGICNGAQVLIEAGLIPGCKNHELAIALTNNKRTRNGHVLGTGYYNQWSYLFSQVPGARTAFTNGLDPGDALHIPFAHAEGRFVMPEDLLAELISNQQTVFCYGDSRGNLNPEFPTNPNGSMYNLAGVCNPRGNVLSLMPHPERTEKGDTLFASMRDYIERGFPHLSGPTSSLTYSPGAYTIEPYKPNNHSVEWIVELIITDNEAFSVQNALRHRGLEVTVTRRSHWEIEFEDSEPESVLDQLERSGELFNSNKERLIQPVLDPPSAATFLVRPKEDLLGRHKLETIRERLEIKGIKAVQSGVLWNINIIGDNFKGHLEEVMATNILFNPFSHNCYRKELNGR